MKPLLRERELRHFMLLDENERRRAIHRLADSGFSDYAIASASALSVEMVRKVLADRVTPQAVP